MATQISLFELSSDIDRQDAARRFARHQRVQVRDVLTSQSARNIADVLARHTPWGLAWKAGQDGPHHIRHSALSTLSDPDHRSIQAKVGRAMAQQDFAYQYFQYPMLDAYLQKWDEGSPQDLLLEHINDRPFLDLVREITGFADLVKADAQATLYAPGQFLASHDDSHVAEGWRVAYVLSLCPADWRPEWGGYLQFLDQDGDIVAGYRPRFNTLNLFAVPQRHHVTLVCPFAPVGRFAITGWFRDR